MAARIAWWLNLDAPLELEDPAHYARPSALRARLKDLIPRMRWLLREEDVIVDPSAPDAGRADFALCFCPTPSALRALEALGFARGSALPVETLRALTRRSFAADLGQTLPGARYVEDLDSLHAHLAAEPSFTGEWLIKRDFAFAGRERRRIREGTLDAPTLGFAKRSFARGQGLQVEPYVTRTADFAQHGYALTDGTLLLGPVMTQHCDVRGTWQASERAAPFALAQEERERLARAAEEAGAALAARGYVGPFGLDAFRYQGPGGSAAFQPRSEVNARFSMGYPRALLDQALATGKAQVHLKL